MHDTVHGEDHAVAAARLDGHRRTLDNRRMAMVEDTDVRSYRPTFAPSIASASGATRRRRCRCSGDRNLVSEAVARLPASKRRRCDGR